MHYKKNSNKAGLKAWFANHAETNIFAFVYQRDINIVISNQKSVSGRSFHVKLRLNANSDWLFRIIYRNR